MDGLGIFPDSTMGRKQKCILGLSFFFFFPAGFEMLKCLQLNLEG